MPVKAMETDASAKLTKIQTPKHQKQLREYVAASAVLHASEGWSYLGRALVSQAAGNTDVARHLGYYAELRAAMSVLATQGIGIFQNSHAIVTSSGDVELLRRGGTHPTTWLTLEAWAKSRSAATTITQVVQPAGVPIDKWIAAFGATASWKPLGWTWLKEWGLDLRRFAKDRYARNEVSYRPRLRPQPIANSENGAEFIRQFWMLFEPRDSEPFSTIDRHLLRRSLDAASLASPTSKPFRERVEDALAEAGEGIDGPFGTFLLRESAPAEPLLFLYANEQATERHPDHHLHVISRGALLLRLATGLVNSLLKDALIGFDDLGFWYERVVTNHGLSPSSQDDPIDMWADVQQALEDLREEISQGGAASYWSLSQTSATPLSILGGTERIGLWALA
jgi:hypothetical protein